MCFVLGHFEETPMVAKRDINVYKITISTLSDYFKPVIKSIYHPSFEWTLGSTVEQEMSIGTSYVCCSNNPITIVDDGFHSYSMKKTYIDLTRSESFQTAVIKSPTRTPGYNIYVDSYTSLINSLGRGDYDIMKCVIPAGSQYFENERGELVSNTIKPISFHRILDLPVHNHIRVTTKDFIFK